MSFRTVQTRSSTNVAAVEYDDETLDLVITFHRNMRRYRYSPVPADAVLGFTTSGLTAGKYFQLYVEGQYPYEELP